MTENLKDHLEKMEKMHISPEVRSSPDELGKLLADEFWEIGSSGTIITRKECIEDGVEMTEMELHDYKVQQLAEEVYLATYFIEDKTRKRNTYRSSLWKYIDERWQLFFHQGTITK